MTLVLCLDPACEMCEAQRQGLMVPARIAEEIIALLRQASVVERQPRAEIGGKGSLEEPPA